MLSSASFALAYALDWLIGDPSWWPHPVRWMGRTISGGERFLRKIAQTPSGEFVVGLVLTVIAVATYGLGSWLLLRWAAGI
jgi:adenosylcobinamide-phosphate synthase